MPMRNALAPYLPVRYRPGEFRRSVHVNQVDAARDPCSCEGQAELAGTAHDDVVQDADADVLQGLRDLVGGVDVLFGRVTLLSGVRFAWERSLRQPPDHELVVVIAAQNRPPS